MKMRLRIFIPAAAIASTLCWGTALADSFVFSYTFNGAALGWPGLVTGELTGTQVGDSTTGYVTGVDVQSLVINGVAVAGPLYNDSWVPLYGPTPNGAGSAVVSFAKLQNNFIFANVDAGLTTDLAAENAAYFAIFPGGYGPPGVADNAVADLPAFIGDYSNYSNDQTRGGVWVLERVPDGGSTIALFGLSISALFGMRERKKLGRV